MWKNILDGQEETELLGLIKQHVGEENPITAGKLTRFFNVRMVAVTGDSNLRIAETSVRRLIRKLRMKHDIPIGSSTQPPAGYYIITDGADLQRNYKRFRNRGLSILAMASHLVKKTMPQFLGQLSLEIAEWERKNGRTYDGEEEIEERG